MIRIFAKRDVPLMDIIELQGKIVVTEEALSAARDAQERRRASRREPRRRGSANNDATNGEDASVTGDDAISLSSAPSSSYFSSGGGSSRSSSTDDEGDGKGSDRARVGPSEDADVEMRGEALHKGSVWCGATGLTSASLSAPRGTPSPCCSSFADPPLPRPKPHTASSRPAVVEVPLGHLVQDRLNEKRCILSIDTLRVHGGRSTFKHPWLVLRECTPAFMRRLRRQMVRTPVPRDGTQGRDVLATSERGGGGAAATEPADGTPEPPLLFSQWLRQHPEALSLDSLFLDDFVTGGTDAASACGPTAAGPTCGAPKAVSSGCPANNTEGHKRQREEESAGGAAPDNRSFAPQSPSSASIVPSAVRATAATAYKNYELVGIVRDAVLFNSKPSRVFQ
ncbi:hypothetical protein JIQ42_07765 [Leishmania sp. Namibia]|uniref:hypothetical protein n=1 Tax=Leishmania sp. Namibia TaxID=2802991 RepID=UPI001B5CBA8C|nr:hypothetical protein JIQ42_07765 [Leishmania sp. Namibia]